MAAKTNTRAAILHATTELFREFGYRGTALKQISSRSGAPPGSVYHHFPGGKAQIAAAALKKSGEGYKQLVFAVLTHSTDIRRGVAAVFKSGAKVLEDSGYIDPCPIGAVAREIASSHPELRQVAHEVMDDWVVDAGKVMRQANLADLDSKAINDLATLLVAAIEGGFLLSRAAQSPEPMLAAGRAFGSALQSLMAGGALHDR